MKHLIQLLLNYDRKLRQWRWEASRMETLPKTINMKYYAHSRSDIMYLMDEDLDFEIISPQGEYPAVLEFGSQEDADKALVLGLVSN